MGRYYSRYDDSGCGCIGVVVIAVLYVIGLFTKTYEKVNDAGKIYMIASVISFACICFSVWSWLNRNKKKKEADEAKLKEKVTSSKNAVLIAENKKLQLSEKCAWDKLEEERNALLLAHNKMDKEFQDKHNKLELQYKCFKNECYRKIGIMEAGVRTSNPFKYVSAMYSDFIASVFEETEDWMINKVRPAETSAEKVKALKAQSKEYVSLFKQMQYKYEFLLSVFPELKQYVDDEEGLIHLSDYKDYEDFSDKRDIVHDWLSDEEYSRMSEDERNQLALDRYKRRNKSNWEIGMEYEMYIGHVLRKDKFFIKQFGIENGLNDLGRDIIAEKAHLDGSRSIYIIQCKNWSKDKELHENVVCQLFGTTLEYQIHHRDLFNTKIIPLLVTTTDLSDTAKEFAKRLGVIWKIVKMGEYPMIKCNINNGSKIYHLPFDQQYYSTKITESTGESYEWTVKDATSKGFRRAMRWRGN